MPVETLEKLQFAYVPEVTFGTTPATPTGKIVRNSGGSMTVNADYIDNPELRTDGQETPGRRGALEGAITINGVMHYGTWDDLMESVMRSAWASHVLKVGSTRKSFTVERGNLEVGLYLPMRGVVAESMQIKAMAGEYAEVSFSMVGAKVGNEATATIWSSTTPPNTNDMMVGWDATVKKGGVTLTGVVGVELNITNNLRKANTIGTPDLYDLNNGGFQASGSVEVYLESNALYTDYRTESPIALQLVLGPGATKTYTFDLSNARITNVGEQQAVDGLIAVTYQFRGFVHATDTALKITRTAS